MNAVIVTEKGTVQTALGPALRISIERADRGVMSFAEVRVVLAERYPTRGAIQYIPPAVHYIDQVNRYHFHLIDGQPQGLDLFDPQEPKEL